jgi:hypothetical protein
VWFVWLEWPRELPDLPCVEECDELPCVDELLLAVLVPVLFGPCP